MRDDYSEAMTAGVRGKYFARARAEYFRIPADLQSRYPTPEAVEAALRRLIELEPAGRP